jgi:hypothetical protein
MGGRIDIEADDVAQLVDEARVGMREMSVGRGRDLI